MSLRKWFTHDISAVTNQTNKNSIVILSYICALRDARQSTVLCYMALWRCMLLVSEEILIIMLDIGVSHML